MATNEYTLNSEQMIHEQPHVGQTMKEQRTFEQWTNNERTLALA